MTLLITGAAGTMGTRIAADLAAQNIQLRLLDRRPRTCDPPADTEFVQADLRDSEAVARAAAEVSAVIHLAGVTQEGPFAEMVEHNITGTHHVLEAARRQRVPRVVLASSHHITGLNPVGTSAQLAPDSFYAVSKVTTEALGYLYAHKTSMQVVAVRIGSYRDRPSEPRHRATWLSSRDATLLLYAAASTLAALHTLGHTEVTVVAREPARTSELVSAAERIGITLGLRPWSEITRHLEAELVISTLPPGAADPLAALWPPTGNAVVDVVYRPWPTPVAKAARQAGSTVISGLSMLIHQAARQVELQTGQVPAPLTAIRKAGGFFA